MTGSGEWRIEPRGDDTGYDVVNGLRWFPSTTRIAAQQTAEYLNAQQQELDRLRQQAALAKPLSAALVELRGWMSRVAMPFLMAHGYNATAVEIEVGRLHGELLARYEALQQGGR